MPHSHYPAMRPEKAALPTDTGQGQPLWQALVAKSPALAGQRVLALHAGDGWFCRHAINEGAVAVLGVDQNETGISAARSVASSDRLRYRIMADDWLPLLTGPFDLIVGTFDLRTDDLHAITHNVSHLLRPGGHLLAAVTTPQTTPPAHTGLTIRKLFTHRLTIADLSQVTDPRLAAGAQLHFLLSSRAQGRSGGGNRRKG